MTRPSSGEPTKTASFPPAMPAGMIETGCAYSKLTERGVGAILRFWGVLPISSDSFPGAAEHAAAQSKLKPIHVRDAGNMQSPSLIWLLVDRVHSKAESFYFPNESRRLANVDVLFETRRPLVNCGHIGDGGRP